MRVRAAVEGDVRAVAALHVAGWQQGYAGLLPADVLAALRVEDRLERWRAGLIDQDLPRRGVLVAEVDDRLAGFASLGPERSGPERRGDGDPRGEVYSFYVDPLRWRRGVGRALMSAAVATLHRAGHAEAVLWVLDTNAPAIAFYTALGWRPDGAIKPDTVGGVEIRDLRMCRSL